MSRVVQAIKIQPLHITFPLVNRTNRYHIYRFSYYYNQYYYYSWCILVTKLLPSCSLLVPEQLLLGVLYSETRGAR
jgi:hypothetical protein